MAGSRWLTIEVPPSAAHANTAVLLRGDEFTATFWANVLATGADIIVYNSSFSKLPRQLVAIDTGAETIELYVKTPTSASVSTFLYLNYDDAAGAEVNDFADYEDYYEQYSARVAASGNDIVIRNNTAAWLGSLSNPNTSGYYNNVNLKYGSGLRWLSLNIQRYSHICSMIVTFTSSADTADVVIKSRFTGELDDGGTFSTVADYQGRRGVVVGGASDDYITTTQVDWDAIAAWVTDTAYASPELKTIGQEQVDHAAQTNLVLFWDDHNARGDQVNNHYRSAYSYDGSAAKAPLLTCNYIPLLDYTIQDGLMKPVGGGSITPASTLGRTIKKGVAGTVTITASLGRKLSKAVGNGSTAIAGALSYATVVRQIVGSGAIAIASTLNQIVKLSLSGTVTLAATLGRKTQKGLSGVITPSGALTSKTKIALGNGAMAISSTLGLIIKKGIGGTVTIASTLGRKIYLSLAGTITPSGTVNRKTLTSIGSGTIAIASTLGLKIKLAVGSGSITAVSTLASNLLRKLSVALLYFRQYRKVSLDFKPYRDIDLTIRGG